MVRSLMPVLALVLLVLAARVSSGQEEHPAAPHDSAAHSDVEGAHGEHGPMDQTFEEPPRRQQSFLVWVIGSLGWKYVLLLPVSALFSFVLTAVLVTAGKGKTTGAAVAFAVAIPLLVGIFGLLDGLVASFMVIANSSTIVKPSEWSEGFSTGLVTPLIGMLLMAPSYILATAGLSIRALKGDAKP